MLDVGIVASQIADYGGSEIFLLECLNRWQASARITLYTPKIRSVLFDEFGIGRDLRVVKLPRSRFRGTRYQLLHEQIVAPRMWEPHIGHHDVYLLFQAPAQMVQCSPSVWFASEPVRILHDLRIQREFARGQPNDALEPKPDYDRPPLREWHVVHSLIEKLQEGACFDRLATHSRSTARYLQSVYGRTADRVVYPGVAPPPPYAPPTRDRQLIAVGRLWDHKRFDLIVDAMALVDPSIQLVMVGHGPDLGSLRKQARSLGLGRRIRFLGEVSVGRRDRLYRESAACLYAPIREPFGMVPLEAASAGRPVIGSPGGGWSEILDAKASRRAALSADSFAEAIEEVVLSPARAQRMGRAARKQVARCTWDRTAAELFELLRQTAGSFAGGSRRRRRARRPELGAHYHVGYRASQSPAAWLQDPDFAGVTDRPVRGYYSSRSRATLEHHVAAALEAGIDFLVVGWRVGERGVSALERTATAKLADAIEVLAAPLRVALELTLTTDDPTVVAATIELARRELMSRPVYHRRAGRSLLWYRINDPLMGFVTQEGVAMRRLNRGVHALATGGLAYNRFLPRRAREAFSGWSLHSPLEISSEERLERLWEQFYRSVCEDGVRLRTFTVSPGHDDSHLALRRREQNAHRVIPRRDLETYERMQAAALALDPAPDLVVVNSFNHFFENTHIEASEKYGDLYLRSTRAFKERLVG